MKPWHERLKAAIIAYKRYAKTHGIPLKGMCQRVMRVSCIWADIEYPGIPGESGILTALHACRYFLKHPGAMPNWVQDHGIGGKPGAWLCFLVPGGKTSSGEEAGHVLLLIVTRSPSTGKLAKWVYDSNTLRPWTQEMASRLRAAFVYKD